jgi:hypothetical protein
MSRVTVRLAAYVYTRRNASGRADDIRILEIRAAFPMRELGKFRSFLKSLESNSPSEFPDTLRQ